MRAVQVLPPSLVTTVPRVPGYVWYCQPATPCRGVRVLDAGEVEHHLVARSIGVRRVRRLAPARLRGADGDVRQARTARVVRRVLSPRSMVSGATVSILTTGAGGAGVSTLPASSSARQVDRDRPVAAHRVHRIEAGLRLRRDSRPPSRPRCRSGRSARCLSWPSHAIPVPAASTTMPAMLVGTHADDAIRPGHRHVPDPVAVAVLAVHDRCAEDTTSGPPAWCRSSERRGSAPRPHPPAIDRPSPSRWPLRPGSRPPRPIAERPRDLPAAARRRRASCRSAATSGASTSRPRRWSEGSRPPPPTAQRLRPSGAQVRSLIAPIGSPATAPRDHVAPPSLVFQMPHEPSILPATQALSAAPA